jgi:hypothetical protein
MTTKLKSFNAEAYAKYYINEKHKPLESVSGFSSYYVRIGEDEKHQPDSVYADTLPINDVLLANDTIAVDAFLEKCDTDSEYLIKVTIDWNNKKLDSKILISPPTK